MKLKITGTIASSILAITHLPASAAVITFEDITLGSSGYWNGSDGSGSISSGGASFHNSYNPTYSSWSGFAISNHSDSSTPGYGNQYSAFPATGAGGSSQYAIGYTGGLTQVSFPALDVSGLGMSVTNTTYTALSMLEGDSFAKKFGGITGSDPDWLKLTITGSLLGNTGASFDIYLADFRSADSAQDYIVTDWTFIDLSALGTVDQISFSIASSDSSFGWPNTPTYFALDNFLAVPEPSALLLSFSGLALLARRRR